MSSWHTHNLVKGIAEKQSKIRKRGCTSSSSSSLVRKYRFKRAILVGKRVGSSTPLPMWKSSTRSPSMAKHQDAQFMKAMSSPGFGCKEKEMSLSARKLAAMWEINEAPPLRVEDLEVMRSKERVVKSLKQPHLSDRTYAPFTEIENHCSGNGHVKGTIGVKEQLKEARNGLATSKKLLKVLIHIWDLPEQLPSGISIIAALGIELDQIRRQVNQLIREERLNQNEIESLMKHFAEEKAARRRREREKIRHALACMGEELEVEKKLRNQTERLNKKIGKELADTRASLLKVTKELEREKRAKEILQQICDELARGIGEDRAQVEELKRESAKVWEEMEKEREMLQIADVLREERVQMKLSEAKYHFEEKNAIVENMRNELEACLRTNEVKQNCDKPLEDEKIKELEIYSKKIQFGSRNEEEKQGDGGTEDEEHERDDSTDSDLHSIELNMDNNNKCYKWSFTCEDDVRGVSVDNEITGRKSISEIQWESICFNKGEADGMKRDSGIKDQENSDQFYTKRLCEVASKGQRQDNEDEIESLLSGSKIASVQSVANNPTRKWGQSFDLEYRGDEDWDGSVVLLGDDLKQKAGGRTVKL
ncbi:Golgin family A protein [Quillaja saponaria]|uniref:Golgin family A protein n=1 Tax=Quillaja saponaria TaxID=32244 RepID=A0AAD7KY41_QUISA|nr:Golgin family A protein [Quillaja saponaria]